MVAQLTNKFLRLARSSLQCNNSMHCQYQCKYSSYEYSVIMTFQRGYSSDFPLPESLCCMADLSLIVLEPCKRKPSSRYENNGDPGPVSRNKKIKTALVATKQNNHYQRLNSITHWSRTSRLVMKPILPLLLGKHPPKM